ncbi:hypothetical protein ES703_25961 [subsurface metagenome]
MKFILKTIIKILIFSLLLIIPTGLFITFFTLNQRDIPVWNIGIRNIILFAKNLSLPIIAISYLVATLFTISLIDKMKVRSLFLLHIPPLLICVALIIGVSFIQQSKKYPLSIIEKKIQPGYRTFLREDVFNDVKDNALMLKRSDQNLFTVYIYDKTKNNLMVLNNMNMGKKGENSVFIDRNKKQMVLTFRQKKKDTSLKIPYSDFKRQGGIINNKIILFYVEHLRRTLLSFKVYFETLAEDDESIFLVTVFLSILMISIPFTYALNDGGWGFSGIIGEIFVLALLPFLYGAVLKIVQNISLNLSFLGRYSYLFPPIIFCSIGILIDIAIKVRGIKKGI